MPLLWTALWRLPGTWVQPGGSLMFLSLSSPTPEHMMTSCPWPGQLAQCSWHFMTTYIGEKQSTKSIQRRQTNRCSLWNHIDITVKSWLIREISGHSVVSVWSLAQWFCCIITFASHRLLQILRVATWSLRGDVSSIETPSLHMHAFAGCLH